MSTALQLAQVFTEHLLNGAVEGVVLTGLVWILLCVSRKQNSGTRFAIWFSALLAIGALPFLSGAVSTIVAGGYRLNPSTLSSPLVLPSSLASYFLAAWIAGAAILLLRLAMGLRRLLVVRRNCLAVDLAMLDPQIAAICRDFSSSRKARLCTSTEVTVPAAIGFFRPAVVFPTNLLASLSTEEVKAILLHELAHLRRWDDWTNLAQKVLKAVFFFHPAVWWIDNHLTLEREMACDDAVLAQTNSPKVYASSLISFAEKLHNARPHAFVQALVSRMRHLRLRVAQILDSKRTGGSAVWKPVVGIGAVVFAAVLGAGPYLPTVVVFKADGRSASAQHIRPAAIHESPQARNRSEARTARAVAGRAPVEIQASKAPALGQQPRVISAVFHSRTIPAGSPRASSVRPRGVGAGLAPDDTSLPPTFMIIQTTRYESSGHAIWTLSVWKLGGQDWSNRQLQSAWIVSSI